MLFGVSRISSKNNSIWVGRDVENNLSWCLVVFGIDKGRRGAGVAKKKKLTRAGLYLTVVVGFNTQSGVCSMYLCNTQGPGLHLACSHALQPTV